jgi:putative addiction module antidote
VSTEAVIATLKLRTIGNSVGVVFPREVLARLKVQEGDVLHVVDTKDGIILTALDPKVAEQLQAGRDVMHRYRDTLSVLAK